MEGKIVEEIGGKGKIVRRLVEEDMGLEDWWIGAEVGRMVEEGNGGGNYVERIFGN